MNNIFSKRQDFFGFNEPVEYEHEYEEDGDGYQNLYQQEHSQPILKQNRRQRRQRMERFAVASEQGIESTMNNVVTMPRVVNAILIIEPCSLEEMPQVIQALQKRESVMLNLTMMDPEQAQRAVDFVAGGIYSIEGHQERLGERIFLFTPSSVQVSKHQHSSVAHEVAQRQWYPNRPMAHTPA